MNLKSGTKVEFGFGVELCADGSALHPGASRIGVERVIERATKLFGGCTLLDTRGTWRDDSGRLFDERGKTLAVLVESIQPDLERRIEELIFYIKHELDQQAVCVTGTLCHTAIL